MTVIRLVVHRTVHDLNRRKCNVIVSGLPEVDDADDTELFTSICETHLSCKPVVLQCRRMGKKSAGKPRRLLIHLRNESLLKSARRLRQSTDPTVAQHIYTNEDLSPEAAKLAFEARQRRRQQRSSTTVTVHKQTSDQHSVALGCDHHGALVDSNHV